MEREAPVEIERKYVLDTMPALPDGARRVEIEQGYVRGDGAPERLRRSKRADGSVVCTHTVKEGRGLVRRGGISRLEMGLDQ